MKSRSVSITGATGFVGRHVAEAYVRDGWQVRAIVRPGNRKPTPAGATVVESGLDAPSLADACTGSDVIIHGAALTRAKDEATFTAVNVEGARGAAIAAATIGARLVLISSQAAGGEGTASTPRRESDPPAPVNAYGRSKLASEAAVRGSEGLAWTILRPCSVYGPRDSAFLPLFRMARRGLFLVPTNADPALTLIYIDDLVRAVMLAASSDRSVGEVLFVGHSDPVKGSDMLRAIAAADQRTFRPIGVPGPVLAGLAAVGDLLWKLGAAPLIDSGRLTELRASGFVCSVDRARDLLGFTAQTPLQEGIAKTARWYKDAGWT